MVQQTGFQIYNAGVLVEPPSHIQKQTGRGRFDLIHDLGNRASRNRAQKFGGQNAPSANISLMVNISNYTVL